MNKFTWATHIQNRFLMGCPCGIDINASAVAHLHSLPTCPPYTTHGAYVGMLTGTMEKVTGNWEDSVQVVDKIYILTMFEIPNPLGYPRR